MTRSSDTRTEAVRRFRQIEDQSKRLNAVSNHLTGRARQAKERFQRAEAELEEERRALARIPTLLCIRSAGPS